MTDLTIAQRLAAHGFNLEGTGGGDSAYIRRDGEIEEFITDSDGRAPTTLDAAANVAAFEDGDCFDCTSEYTMRDVLAALDNPSDEYCLLTLRLSNRLHVAG